MSRKGYRDLTARHLAQQGVSRGTATRMAGLLDRITEFKVPRRSGPFDAYLCFAFGNEVDPFGNVHPGAVNKALAAVTRKKYLACPKPILAQWEIGELLKQSSDIASKHVYSFDRAFDVVQGRPAYESTRDFVERVRKTNKRIRRVLVVAQWFHYARCVQEVERAGLKAVTDQQSMPRLFCTERFGQLWTSSEDWFVLHTLTGSLMRHRDEKTRKRRDNP